MTSMTKACTLVPTAIDTSRSVSVVSSRLVVSSRVPPTRPVHTLAACKAVAKGKGRTVQSAPSTSRQIRHLHSSRPTFAQFSFDTAHFVNRLEREGLSRQQAVGIMEALEEVVEESVRTMTANLVTKAEQEKHRYTQKVDFQRLKSEITLLEKQDFSLLKSENERLLSEVERLKQRLREEVCRASV